MKNDVALGLYSYSLPHPGDAGFKAFCDDALALLRMVGLEATYFGAEGGGHRGESVPINGRSHKKSMERGFAQARAVSIVCNPPGSNEPAFDRFAELSLSFLPSVGETLLTFVVDESRFDINSEEFIVVREHLQRSQRWDFGYAVSSQECSNPSFYVLALDDGKLSKNEMDELLRWYNSSPEARLKKVRNVHQVNVVNRDQLSAVGEGGQSLRAIIEADGSSSLKAISDDLWLWSVPSEAVTGLKQRMAGSGFTISGG